MTKPINDITADEVKALLDYDPETGIFRYRVTRTGWIRKGEIAGCKNGEGYWTIQINGRAYQAHRLAFLIMTGDWPKDHVDHRHGYQGDNAWIELREATRSQNMHNRAIHSNNMSGHPGVGFYRRSGRWYACITVNRKQIHLGYFDTKDEAISARIAGEEQHFGEFRRAHR